MNITYFKVTGTPLRSGDYCYGIRWRNFGFKQFVTAVGIYAVQILYDHG